MSGFATRPFCTALIVLSISASILLTGCGTTAIAASQPQALAAQGTPAATVGVTNVPTAYVYVSNSPQSNKVEINAYSAASNGTLAKISGSPFSTGLEYGASMAAHGRHLFFTNGVEINSYYTANNGALQQVGSINASQFNQSNCGGPVALFLDQTGATLYDLDIYSDCANNAYQFFNTEVSTSELSYLGVTTASSPIFQVALSFLGSNEYAYGASCYHWAQNIFGFLRSSSGALTDLNISPSMPIAKSGQMYCPGLAAADATIHVAVPMQPINISTLQPVGPDQLATYTADSSGNLTTSSTYSNMPKVAVATITGVLASPSGKLLAVAGTGGLQIFRFNGANPITPFSGLLTTNEVDQLAWDNANHLYALSQSSGKLFVYTITTTNFTQASGSPYTITNPGYMVVLSQ
ncbi:MAG: hypothetical protein JWQ87_544 [Candidatus Sulfotelmatobacter sp.]|nr:hypothetical protein [Candidatus Sulfotelmatobacter sp.]